MQGFAKPNPFTRETLNVNLPHRPSSSYTPSYNSHTYNSISTNPNSYDESGGSYDHRKYSTVNNNNIFLKEY